MAVKHYKNKHRFVDTESNFKQNLTVDDVEDNIRLDYAIFGNNAKFTTCVPLTQVPVAFLDICDDKQVRPEELIPVMIEACIAVEDNNEDYPYIILDRILNSDLPNKNEIIKVICDKIGSEFDEQ